MSECIADIVMGLGEIRMKPQRRLEARLGLVEPTQLGQDRAEIVMRLRKIGP